MIELRSNSDWKTKNGAIIHIVRRTINSPLEGDRQIYWSLSGNWYRVDGAYMAYDSNNSIMYALRDSFKDPHKGEFSSYDIIEEVVETP